MNPYTILYTNGTEIFSNVWEATDLEDAIDFATNDLQLNEFETLTVLEKETLAIEENQY